MGDRNNNTDENDIGKIIENTVKTVGSALCDAGRDVASSLGISAGEFLKNLHLEVPGEANGGQHRGNTENQRQTAPSSNSFNRALKPRKRLGVHPFFKYTAAVSAGAVSIWLLVHFAGTAAFLAAGVTAGVFAATAAAFLLSASGSESLYKRYRQIFRILGNKAYQKISTLADTVKIKPSKLRRQLEKLIDKGYFGTGAYIDLKNDVIVLRPDEYKDISDEEESVNDCFEADDAYDKWISDLEDFDRRITDEEVSMRVRELSMYSRRIFDYLKLHPDCQNKARSFMNYYIPLTAKLLDSYERIEKAGVIGENMKSTVDNIEKTLSTLCEAYRQQLDELYSAEAMDISSDIDVLKKIMERDGFDSDSPFEQTDKGRDDM